MAPLPTPLRRFFALLLFVIALGACGSSDGTETVAAVEGVSNDAEADADTEADTDATAAADADAASGSTGEPGTVETDADLSVKPEIRLSGGEPPATMTTEDIVVGDGAEAVAGDKVTVHYVGVLYDGGEEFDSSWNRSQTFDFTLGQGQVIRGWDEGVQGMKVGGRRMLVLPPDFAYGANGAGGVIGPGATLVFVVDLVDIPPPPAPLAPIPDRPTVVIDEPSVTELKIIDDVVGDGAEIVAGSTATVHYVGASGSTGEEFDASWNRDQPFPVPVGVGRVIPGWDQGLIGMKVGGRRTLIIPPDLAYGDTPPPNSTIAPGETLYFIVDLLRVE